MKLKFLLFIAIVFLINLNLISADFTLGNLSYNLEVSYGLSEPISGWINISLDEEPATNLLTGFENEISLIDFLDENEMDCRTNSGSCSCFPIDCESKYTIQGTRKISGEYNILERNYKIFGIKITEPISRITNINFSISSDAKKSCIPIIKVDLLADDSVEWESNEISEDSSCFIEKPSGCYESQYVISNPMPIELDSLYCQTIELPPMKGFKVGAKINGSNSAKFEFILEGESCQEEIEDASEVSCIIELDESLEDFTETEVCLSLIEGATYSLNYENNQNSDICGRKIDKSGIKYQNDFEIFVNPIKYKELTDFTFDQFSVGEIEEGYLVDQISSYIDNKYENECDPECIVPIKLLAGINQNVEVSNVNLEYIDSNGAPRTIDNFYTVNKEPALVTMDFSKLDMLESEILTPSEFGSLELVLKLGGNEILEEEISVKRVPQITDLLPKEPPSLIEVNFVVLVNNDKGNLSYKWDFGDGNKKTSNKGIIRHTYSNIGPYTITVNVSNDYGESSMSFPINVVAPNEAINRTLIKYQKYLKNIGDEISNLPAWIQAAITKKIDVEELKSLVEKKETKYKETLDSETEELINIMTGLLALNIPYKFGESQIIKKTDFIQDKEKINLDTLEYFGAGTPEADVEAYANAINNWFISSLKTTIESKTYSLFYDGGSQTVLFSYVKLDLEPKDNLDEFYVVINGNPIETIINGDFRERDYEESAMGLIFSDLEEAISIELLHPDKMNILSLPIYVSPEFNDLDLTFVPGACNNNGRCEKDLNETTKNCKNDCKRWGWIIFFLILLIIFTFIIYIALQEWYKRNYENYLFINKNQLFNLINFMYNSNNQGINKKDILDKLEKTGWKREQLDYAWKKFKGERTGMWEIPLFTRLQSKNIKSNLKNGKRIQQPPIPNTGTMLLKQKTSKKRFFSFKR